MYGCVVFLVFSNVQIVFIGILEAYYVTCVHGASMVLKQIINNSYDDDHLQDMTRIHNQVGIVL